MNTLTLSPDLNNDKEARRARYDGRKQDHGTAGTATSDTFYRAMRAENGHEKRTRENRFAQAITIESIADAATELRSKNLRAAADAILKASGFIDKEPEVSFLSATAVQEEDSIFDESSRLASNPDIQDGHTIIAVSTADGEHIYDAIELMDSVEDPAEEVRGNQRNRRTQMYNADRVYQGYIDPSDDMGDYVDGFHITSR